MDSSIAFKFNRSPACGPSSVDERLLFDLMRSESKNLEGGAGPMVVVFDPGQADNITPAIVVPVSSILR